MSCFSGTITNETWVPSTIPIPAVHLPDTLTTYSHTDNNHIEAATNCLNVLNNATIADHCEAMPSSVVDHFLEACIREYEQTGAKEAIRILHYSLIYYCVTVINVDECVFDHYFYFCDEKAPDDADFPVWLIILIVCSVILIIAIICICCYFLVFAKKKKRKKDKKDGTRLISHHKFGADVFVHDNEAMHETAFVRDSHVGIGGPSFEHEGRDSPDFRLHHESHAIDTDDLFETPIMFIGAPPAETFDHEHKHSETSAKVQQFQSPLQRFLGRSVVHKPGQIEHIDVSPPSKVNHDRIKHDRVETKHDIDKSSHQAASSILDKAWQDERPSSPHPPPDTQNVHPQGTRPKVFKDSVHGEHGQAHTSFSTFRVKKGHAPAIDAPTSIRGRHSPDIFKETPSESNSPHIVTKYHHARHSEVEPAGISEEAKSSLTFSRNIHPEVYDDAHGHPSLFRAREAPLPLLEDDQSSAFSSSRGSTPPEGAKREKKKKSKQKGTSEKDSSIPSPWEKYKATLPPPIGKTKGRKKSSKVKPKETRKGGILGDTDFEEQTKL